MNAAAAVDNVRNSIRSTAIESDPEIWTPTERQAAFLSSSAFEALYGGSVGGGKTFALVIGALRHIDKPAYNAIIFRRTFVELEGEVIPVSRQWYPVCGGKYNANQHCWYFPSGARIHFGHLQHESDVERYRGWQFQYVGYDELTHFTEKQYTFIVNSRVRSATGIPARIRAGTNPGGVGHDWVFRRWAPWLDPDSPVKAEPQQKLYYRNEGDETVWLDGDEKGELSRVFVPAMLADNPYLIENDPGYAKRLAGLDRVTREQTTKGNWLIKPSAGAYYKRRYFEFVDAAPAAVVARVRHWDLAATPPSETNKDPDWTVGARMSRGKDGTLYIEDVVRERLSPGAVEQMVLNTASSDGKAVTVSLPQDPGQAGKAQKRTYANLLAGYVFRCEPETGDKETRQKPLSAQAEAGNVKIVRGAWNEKFLAEAEAFPSKGVHDDQIDAVAGAFDVLTSGNAAWISKFTAAMRNK